MFIKHYPMNKKGKIKMIFMKSKIEGCISMGYWEIGLVDIYL